MYSRKELTVEERKVILNNHKQKKSYNEIAKIIGRSKATVQKVVQRFSKENRIENKARCGRPRKLTVRDDRHIHNILVENPFQTATKIATKFKVDLQKDVSADTVRRSIKRGGLTCCTAIRKPYVSETNRKKRLDFANSFLTVENTFWDNVMFSDESKFNIFGFDGRLKVWRKPNDALNPKNTIKTVRHGGGSVMVWGCMSSAGVGNLVFIDDILNKEGYLKILQENLPISAEKLGLVSNWYFQQDNDPKHTAHIVKMWLVHKVPHLLNSPPQSPDLNPIENLWEILDKCVREHNITTKAMLKKVLLEEWNKISPETTKKLVHSMTKRLEDVITHKGYPTKY